MGRHPAFQTEIAPALSRLPLDPQRAVLFPGQGSQKVGMGKDLHRAFPAVRRLFDEADEILQMRLSAQCFQGPREALLLTENAQPAILVVSLAYLLAAIETGLLSKCPNAVAGHSLGQYTALVAAGSLQAAAAVRLVHERGKLMAAAGRQHPGGMAALLGLDEATVRDICGQTGAEPANYNGPTQIVVGGPPERVNAAMEAARKAGGKALPVNVSGAFHTTLMQPAAAAFAEQIEAAEIHDPQVVVISNVSALPLADAAAIRKDLQDQLTSPVRWHQSVEFMMRRGVMTFMEAGPGRVLTAMLKRAAPDVTAIALDDHALVPAPSNV